MLSDLMVNVNNKIYNCVIKVYSTNIEVFFFRNEKLKNYEVSKGRSMKVKRGQSTDEAKKKANQERARIRASSTVKELIKANELCYHWVLTYAVPGKDLKQVKKDFELFIMRLKYALKLDMLKYVAVPEVQEKRKSKYGDTVWHMHLATDIFVKHKVVEKAWSFGHVFAKRYKEDRLEGVAGYLSKYLSKDYDKYEFPDKKRYMCSKGLKRANKQKAYMDVEKAKEKADIVVEYDSGIFMRLKKFEKEG